MPWQIDRTATFWENLALRLLERDCEDAAFAAFLRAARTEPTREWLGLFQLWRIIERHHGESGFTWGETAIDTFKQLAQQHPGDRTCALNLAEALSRTGNFEAARPWYRQACQSSLESERPDLAQLPRTQTPVPHFTVIGVMRSGTTALYQYLSQHPQIFPTARKEIHFWSWRYGRGLDWYLAHFPELPESGDYITGEASPSYFPHRKAPQRMFDAYPNMKLVAIFRNPVDRTISHYYHARRHHTETRSLQEALRIHRDRFDRGDYKPNENNNYFASSLYAVALERWLQVFPRDRLHVIFSEDLFQNPQDTLDRLCDFLGIPTYSIEASVNPNPGGYDAIDSTLRRELSEYFIPYNQKLADLLQCPVPFAPP